MLTFDQYLTPATLADALRALHEIPGARVVAGATDLLPWARDGRAGDVHLSALVDVSRLAELGGISLAEDASGWGRPRPSRPFSTTRCCANRRRCWRAAPCGSPTTSSASRRRWAAT